jgi:hypothetical protein
MSYRDQLQPWCIIRCLPNAQTITVARFRRRSDAEAYLRTLRQLTPTASFRIVFDGGSDRGFRVTSIYR